MLAGRGGNIDGEICDILFCPLDVEKISGRRCGIVLGLATRRN